MIHLTVVIVLIVVGAIATGGNTGIVGPAAFQTYEATIHYDGTARKVQAHGKDIAEARDMIERAFCGNKSCILDGPTKM